jgi:hypothetical protein
MKYHDTEASIEMRNGVKNWKEIFVGNFDATTQIDYTEH